MAKEKGTKNKQFFSGLLVLFIAILIIAAVISGTYYFIINRNFKGVADRYRNFLSEVPVFRNALPKIPDYEDSTKYTFYQLANKYDELKNEADALRSENSALKQQLTDNENRAAELDRIVKQAEEDMKKVNEILNSNGKPTDEARKFLELYEAVDPKVTARIFEKMGENKIELIAQILKKMKKEVSAEIIAEMELNLSAKLTEQLSTMVGVGR